MQKKRKEQVTKIEKQRNVRRKYKVKENKRRMQNGRKKKTCKKDKGTDTNERTQKIQIGSL
jgi:hypothetical protein